MWLRVAAVLGFLGVACGAFGAHALKSRLPENLLAAWHTAVQYHLLHAVALLALALYARSSGQSVDWPAGLMLAGVVLFSGSLYAMALSGVTRLGIVTPLGGLCLLAGWIALSCVGLKR